MNMINIPGPVWFRLAEVAENEGRKVEEVAIDFLSSSVGLLNARRRHSIEVNKHIGRLWETGMTDAEIAKLLGVSGETVRKRRHDLGLPNNGKQGRKPRKVKTA